MSDVIIGTCSQCGGTVTIPKSWMGAYPPIPTCQECGATQESPVVKTTGGNYQQFRGRFLRKGK